MILKRRDVIEMIKCSDLRRVNTCTIIAQQIVLKPILMKK